MRDLFGSYYRPTDDDFEALWRDAIFVLDTNVLLNLYRYSAGTRNQLLKLLRENKDRLWLPHRVAHEYLRSRLGAIQSQRQKSEDMREYLRKTLEQVEGQLDTLHRDPGIEAEPLLEEVRDSFKKLINYISELADSSLRASNSPEDDRVWTAIDEIFAGNVGSPYDPEREKEIFTQGEKRYEDEVPPGYKDAGKDGAERFGDLVIWLQIIDRAKAVKKPVIFVTADTKEDWWWKSQGHTLGPRRELLEEMRREANVLFHIYTPEHFMSYARTSLEQEVTDEAIAEVQETRERDEAASEARRREIQDDLLAMWSELTDEEQTYANLHYNAGRSIEEIAETEDRSVQEVEDALLLVSSKIRRRNEESQARSRAAQRLNPPSGSPASVPKPAWLPSEEQRRHFAELQEQSRKHAPSPEQMREIRRVQEAASKNMPSEREMRQLREMQRYIDQHRKGLGF